MSFKYFFNSAVATFALPVISYQGKKIRANTPNLQEARGIEGESFQDFKSTMNIITVGDSSMAGVGVRTHKEGFVGTLADELASHYSINVSWKVYAKSGFTALKVKDRLVPTIQEEKLDLIVIGVGGNDAFKLTSPKEWISDIRSLIDEIRVKYKNQPIVFINMPPVREIPAFTSLIKYVMGNLMDAYSDELVQLVKSMDNVFYCSSKISFKDYSKRHNLNAQLHDFFSAEDKFHPSKLAYQFWAKDTRNFILKNKVIDN